MGSFFGGLLGNSFQSFWYWALLGLIWMLTGNRVLGVPWDMVLRLRHEPELEPDIAVLLRLNATRQTEAIAGYDGLMWGLLACALTMVFLWGFVYGIPFAQAAFFLLAPISVVWGMAVRTAKLYLEARPTGLALYHFLDHHRWQKHLIMIAGMIAVTLWAGVQSLLRASFLG